MHTTEDFGECDESRLADAVERTTTIGGTASDGCSTDSAEPYIDNKSLSLRARERARIYDPPMWLFNWAVTLIAQHRDVNSRNAFPEDYLYYFCWKFQNWYGPTMKGQSFHILRKWVCNEVVDAEGWAAWAEEQERDWRAQQAEEAGLVDPEPEVPAASATASPRRSGRAQARSNPAHENRRQAAEEAALAERNAAAADACLERIMARRAGAMPASGSGTP
jgi:hypothetical protein